MCRFFSWRWILEVKGNKNGLYKDASSIQKVALAKWLLKNRPGVLLERSTKHLCLTTSASFTDFINQRSAWYHHHPLYRYHVFSPGSLLNHQLLLKNSFYITPDP
jgi:ABC-type Na+ transport system ATPase subunit NatA